MDSVNSPKKIVWLSGPSSSGKTTYTRSLENDGWIRIEPTLITS
jgi:adenylylsulfate kinase-like enzyme